MGRHEAIVIGWRQSTVDEQIRTKRRVKTNSLYRGLIPIGLQSEAYKLYGRGAWLNVVVTYSRLALGECVGGSTDFFYMVEFSGYTVSRTVA